MSKIAEAMRAAHQQCQVEDDCERMPWCRIRGKCLKAQPQQERTEPSEALRNAFKAHYGDERGRTVDANRAFDEFAAGWQAALAQQKPLTDEQIDRTQD